MRSASFSLAARALLAVLLTIGFYGLALAIAAGLLFIPYAELRFAHRLHFQLAVACLAGAGTILWAIMPRRDVFQPPGPRLDPTKHPRLFDSVQDIAQKTNQRAPAEIYLIPDVNAFVAERGGFMGTGSRRVMGIGLAMLQAFTVPQFRAVLAHEFGHFYGGDTKLSPWIYKTRMAIIRTVLSLRQRSLLQAPFHAYARLFLRITHAISRRQEFVADELAARIVGAKPLADGLRTTRGTVPAFQAFWQTEVAPVLGSGYRPPLVEGFALFTGASSITEAMQRTIEKELASAETNPYDTHPSLRERIAAVQALPPGPDADDDTPALSLLQDVPELERRLLAHLFGAHKVQSWKRLAWQEVGMAVYVPAWEELARDYATALAGVTPAALPGLMRSPDPLVPQLRRSASRSLSQEEITRGASNVAGAALALALLHEGWELETAPGAAISLRRGEHAIEPFRALARLVSKKLDAETWQQRCEQAGIADLDLGNLVG